MLLATTPTGAGEMRPAESGDKCPSSLIQCPNIVTGHKEEVLWLLPPEWQDMREQGGAGLIGNACPQLDTAGQSWTCAPLSHESLQFETRLVGASSWISFRSQALPSSHLLTKGETLVFIDQDGSQSPPHRPQVWL